MSHLTLPITKATGLGPLPKLLEEMAGDRALNRVFPKARLPMDIIEFPETWIPFTAMRDLFSIAAQTVGDRCFGLSVGQYMHPRSFGLWMDYCAQAPTLAKGLHRVLACAKFQQTGGFVTCDQTAPVAFWRYHAPGGLSCHAMQHSDHLIGPMLRFVRAYLGPDWQPEWVEVNYPRDALAGRMERQLGLPVRFGCETVALAIKHGDLYRARFRHDAPDCPLTYADIRASEHQPGFAEPVQTVYSVITLRLLDGSTDIDGAASALGVGVQKLQRSLRRDGLDYRGLLDRAIQIRAQALLAETDLPVTQIAFALGYSDHGNFSRSFKRMVGVAPVQYRATKNTAAVETSTH